MRFNYLVSFQVLELLDAAVQTGFNTFSRGNRASSRSVQEMLPRKPMKYCQCSF